MIIIEDVDHFIILYTKSAMCKKCKINKLKLMKRRPDSYIAADVFKKENC